MPSYDICYLHEDGSLLGAFSAEAASDKHAKILAHAMRLSGAKALEVWCGETLIYARPERAEAARRSAAPDAALQEAARRAAA